MVGKSRGKITRQKFGKIKEERERKRRGERGSQSITASIDQLMCCSEDVILQETEEKAQGQRKEARKIER